MFKPMICEASPYWYRELRRCYGLSVQQVSDLTGAPFSTVKAWEFESGAVSPSVIQLGRLAALYGVHWQVAGASDATEAMAAIRQKHVPRGEFFDVFAQLVAAGATREEAMTKAVRQVQGEGAAR